MQPRWAAVIAWGLFSFAAGASTIKVNVYDSNGEPAVGVVRVFRLSEHPVTWVSQLVGFGGLRMVSTSREGSALIPLEQGAWAVIAQVPGHDFAWTPVFVGEGEGYAQHLAFRLVRPPALGAVSSVATCFDVNLKDCREMARQPSGLFSVDLAPDDAAPFYLFRVSTADGNRVAVTGEEGAMSFRQWEFFASTPKPGKGGRVRIVFDPRKVAARARVERGKVSVLLGRTEDHRLFDLCERVKTAREASAQPSASAQASALLQKSENELGRWFRDHLRREIGPSERILSAIFAIHLLSASERESLLPELLQLAPPESIFWAAAPPTIPVVGSVVSFASREQKRDFLTRMARGNADPFLRAYSAAELAVMSKADDADPAEWMQIVQRYGAGNRMVEGFLRREVRQRNRHDEGRRVLPKVVLRSPNGEETSLKLGARLTVLNFSATWCIACRAMVPQFVELNAAYSKTGLEIVTVMMGASPEELRKYLVDNPLERWRHVACERDSACEEALDIERVPQVFVYDARGKLVAGDSAVRAVGVRKMVGDLMGGSEEE